MNQPDDTIVPGKGLQIIVLALVCWALAFGFTYALWAFVLWLLGDIP